MEKLPEVFEQIARGIREEAASGRKFVAMATVMIDERGLWAGLCGGVDLQQLREYLQHARDDATLGGKGFTVFTDEEAPPVPSPIIMPAANA